MTSIIGKVAIVGYGSIGQRHAKNFRALGVDVALVTARTVSEDLAFTDIETMLAHFEPHAVLISNRTADHVKALQSLRTAGFAGLAVVEKPIFAHAESFSTEGFRDIRVAYNLRFHRILMDLKAQLAGQRVVSVHAYVGQHLSTWRPQADYRRGYSAKVSEGGGVLLDLSHEFDFLQWMFGRFEKVVAHGGHFSELEIETEDTFSVIGVCERAPHVSVSLNYTDRNKARRLTVITATHTFEADLIQGRLTTDGVAKTYVLEGNHSYEAMTEDLVQKGAQGLTSFKEAVETVRLVEALKVSNTSGKWVSL